MSFPLIHTPLENGPFHTDKLEALISLINTHIAEQRYPGCQIALAWRGQMLLNQPTYQTNDCESL